MNRKEIKILTVFKGFCLPIDFIQEVLYNRIFYNVARAVWRNCSNNRFHIAITLQSNSQISFAAARQYKLFFGNANKPSVNRNFLNMFHAQYKILFTLSDYLIAFHNVVM